MDRINDSGAIAKPGQALARRLGLFDATMIVMGGIIGSGIFMNPSVVARQVTTPFLILLVWALGGLIALAAAFIWAELAALRPEVGGQYAYLREAYHANRIPLRLGAPARHTNWRHGGGGRHLRSLLSGTNQPGCS